MSITSQPVIILVLLISGLIIMWASSKLTIGSATKVSLETGLSETNVGFLLLAFTTSVPELVITVISSSSGAVDLAMGNIIGSNVANIGIIIGAPFLILRFTRQKTSDPITMSSIELRDIFSGLLVASAIPLFLIIWPLSFRPIGGLLLISYILISYLMVRGSKRSTIHQGEGDRSILIKASLTLLLGIAGVILSSALIVSSAVSMASSLGISQTIIGATIIAVGTSLPELAISISAVWSKHRELALGNAVGSCFANITIVLGTLLLISPIKIIPMDFLNQIAFTLLMNIFLFTFVFRKRLGGWESTSLIILYVLFTITTLEISLPL